MSKYSLMIGRYQPFHEGHQKLVQKVLDEGKKVCIALRDTPIDENNHQKTILHPEPPKYYWPFFHISVFAFSYSSNIYLSSKLFFEIRFMPRYYHHLSLASSQITVPI